MPPPWRVSRFLGYRLVREDAYPDVPAAADMAGDGPPGRLCLAAGQPVGFQRLEAVVAEYNGVSHPGLAAAVAFMSLAVLHPLRL